MFLRHALAVVCCLAASQAAAQSIHLTDEPAGCDVWFDARLGARYSVVLYAPDHQNAVGAHFRLDVTDFGPEDEAILTAPAGMTVVGNVRDGVVVTWAPHTFWVEEILQVEFVDNDPVDYPDGFVFASVVDAMLIVPGSALDLEDTQSYRIHCYQGGGLEFEPPVDGTVVAGATTMVAFRGISLGGYYGPGATNLTAADTQGWVQPFQGALWTNGCSTCPWWWETLTLTATVPEGTPEGTVSMVTIREGSHDLISFALTATRGTPVESRTWGAVKALYR